MRPIAIGQKKRIFVGSPAAGSRAAVLMSVIANCKSNQVEPWAYPRDVLTRLALKPTQSQLDAMLPNHWLTPNPKAPMDNRPQKEKRKKTKGVGHLSAISNLPVKEKDLRSKFALPEYSKAQHVS